MCDVRKKFGRWKGTNFQDGHQNQLIRVTSQQGSIKTWLTYIYIWLTDTNDLITYNKSNV